MGGLGVDVAREVLGGGAGGDVRGSGGRIEELRMGMQGWTVGWETGGKQAGEESAHARGRLLDESHISKHALR